MKRIGGYSVALLIFTASLLAPLRAQQVSAAESNQIEPEAMEALNKMGAYLRTLTVFQVRAEITSEDVLTDGEKVQFTHTANILARKPDRLLVEIDGDQKSRLYLFDGKTFTLFARRAGYYATVNAPATIGDLADVVSEKYNIEIPLVDLFRWDGTSDSTAAITSASNIGPGQVGGVSCEHYAFRQAGLDWQVWLQMGDYPLPRKLVLTTMTDEARPQQVSVLSWNLAPSFNDLTFTFDPPTGVSKITFAEDEAASAAGKN
jgi:hypothetical protein